MAEEKFTIVDLRKAVAKQTGTEEAQVGAFLNQLIAAIKEGLKKDKQVRISGLGTFKLQWVEPRKSVNISTGEPIVIEGYQKLSFTPEPSVKERINEPYADLVPVELDAEGNPIETQEKPKSDRMQRFDEQALEIKDLLADLGADLIPADAEETPQAEEPIAEEPIAEETVAEETVAEETVAEETVAEETVAEEAIEDNEIDKAIEAAVATVAAVREIPKEPIEEEKPAEPATEKKKEEPKKEEKPKKPFRGWLAALITVAVILLLLVAAFFFFQMKTLEFIDKISERINGKETVAETPEPTAIAPDTCALDTCAADSLLHDSLMAENKAETTTPAKTETAVVEQKAEVAEPKAEAAGPKAETVPIFNTDFYKERNYTEFIGMETVKEGSRLTWIAKKYYGSKDLWVFIYEANREKIKNPSNVVVGTQLQIPALPEEIIKQETPKAQNFVKGLQDKYLNK